MNWYISVDIPESATMASGGHCGHGVMMKMQLHLGQCQAQRESKNTERKCQQTTKTLAWPDAGRKDGSLNATHLWPRFLGVNMKIVLDVQLSSFGINIDVQPDKAINKMSGADQQAIAEEAIRALEHYIIMVTPDQEVS
jgi:hypothetical protein